MEQGLSAEVLFLGLAAIAAIAGLALFVSAGGKGLRELDFLERPITPIGQAQPGPVHLKGQVQPDDDDFDLLDSPLSNKPCLFSRLYIEHKLGRATELGLMRTSLITAATVKEQRRRKAEKSLRRAILDDGTGQAIINLKKSRLVLQVDHEGRTGGFRVDDPGVERALRLHGIRVGVGQFDANYEVAETILEPGDTVEVFGTFVPGEDRGRIGPEGDREPLVTDWPPAELAQGPGVSPAVRKAGGVLLFLLAAGLVLISLMVMMQKPAPVPEAPPAPPGGMQPL